MHVGLFKTGTTSIQQTLSLEKNNKLLEVNGYLYPKIWATNHSIPIYSSFCDHPENIYVFVNNNYSMDKIKDINNSYLKKFETVIAQKQHSKLIISSEAIPNLSYENLKALKRYINLLSKNDVKIKVLVYVRNPVPWSVSSIQQMLKVGQTYQGSLKHIRALLKNLFHQNIEKFVRIFGKECVEVYSFEKAIANEYGLVGHFLSCLGFKNSEISNFNIIRANESISLIAGDIISFINKKLPLIEDGKLHPNRSGNDYIPFLDIKGPKYDIPFSVKKELFDFCQDDIKWLKDNYGIDYSVFPKAAQPDYEFTSETIKGIKKVYKDPKVSMPLKGLIVEYLQKQLKNRKKDNSALLLKELLRELNSQ